MCLAGGLLLSYSFSTCCGLDPVLALRWETASFALERLTVSRGSGSNRQGEPGRGMTTGAILENCRRHVGLAIPQVAAWSAYPTPP